MLHIKTTRKPTNQKITPKPNKPFPSPPNKTPTPRKGQLIIKNTWRQEELWNKASFPHYITFPIKYCHLFPFSRQRYHDFLNFIKLIQVQKHNENEWWFFHHSGPHLTMARSEPKMRISSKCFQRYCHNILHDSKHFVLKTGSIWCISPLTVLEKRTYITSGCSATYLNKALQSLKYFFHERNKLRSTQFTN